MSFSMESWIDTRQKVGGKEITFAVTNTLESDQGPPL